MGGQTAAHLFLNGGRIQESGVAGVAEYASKVFIRESGTGISLKESLPKLPNSVTPELLQLLNSAS
jgi:hypothetical protein